MDKLNITSRVLDKLGFSEYWDENGTWGGRSLKFANGTVFRIIEQDEMDDDSEGWNEGGRYVANHYYFADWFAVTPPIKDGHHDLFFIHEMYQCLLSFYPNCVDEFVEKCKAVLMDNYIKQYKERTAFLVE